MNTVGNVCASSFLLQCHRKNMMICRDGRRRISQVPFIWLQRGWVIWIFRTNKLWALNIDKRIIVLSAANVFFVKGGDVQLSEARQRQQMVAHQSKLQKKVLTSCLNKRSNDHLCFGALYLTVMFLGLL